VLDREMPAPNGIEEVQSEVPSDSQLLALGDASTAMALHQRTVELEKLRVTHNLARQELDAIKSQRHAPRSDAERYAGCLYALGWMNWEEGGG